MFQEAIISAKDFKTKWKVLIKKANTFANTLGKHCDRFFILSQKENKLHVTFLLKVSRNIS